MSEPLSAITTAPWWYTFLTGTGLLAFVMGYIRPAWKFLWPLLVAKSDKAESREKRLGDLSMQLVDQSQEDLRNARREVATSRLEADTERKRADTERASGQRWYYIARAWESKAHDVRHDGNNQLTRLACVAEALSQRLAAITLQTPQPIEVGGITELPALEDISK